ncbi:unnamed protein product [Mytilus edulis]|uniref:Uncharacterized protein n=1 Tax=Mytilus edulis TaxID=6550 RepID=A0A8S3SRC3_MYTED|nr:unnamed protein product [Mytilus edulis]
MSGRLAFAAHSVRYPFNPPYSQIHLYNCTIKENKQGILTKHYNNPSNEKLEIFHRIKEEELRFEMVNVYDNVEEAMYIPSLTKYHDRLIPTPEEMTTPERLGVIKYKMERCKFHRNGKELLPITIMLILQIMSGSGNLMTLRSGGINMEDLTLNCPE